MKPSTHPGIPNDLESKLTSMHALIYCDVIVF